MINNNKQTHVSPDIQSFVDKLHNLKKNKINLYNKYTYNMTILQVAKSIYNPLTPTLDNIEGNYFYDLS
jgi:hypothetical protein